MTVTAAAGSSVGLGLLGVAAIAGMTAIVVRAALSNERETGEPPVLERPPLLRRAA